MNSSVSTEIRLYEPVIDFALTEAQMQLTANALQAATGKSRQGNVFTIVDVARAVILMQGAALLNIYEDVPHFTKSEDLDHYMTNYMDGVAQLDQVVAPLVLRRRSQQILEGTAVKRIALGDRVALAETNLISQ